MPQCPIAGDANAEEVFPDVLVAMMLNQFIAAPSSP